MTDVDAVAASHVAQRGNSKFTGLYWPSPPYARYPEPTLWVEPPACELEDSNGVVHAVHLALFKPADESVMVFLANKSSPVRVQFSQFRRLTLTTPLAAKVQSEEVSAAEVSHILGFSAQIDYQLHGESGSVIAGKTVGYIQTDFGIFLFSPVAATDSVVRVFVPHHAYQRFTTGEQIGQMLVAERLVTSAQVEEAASQQRNLRERKLGDYLVGDAIVSPDQLLVALDQQRRMPMIRVGDALTRLGYIDQAQLDSALEKQKTERTTPLGQLLLNMGALSRRDLNTALARKMGYPVVDVANFPIAATALQGIPQTTVRRLGVMPLLRQDGVLVVASVDPTRRDVVEELEFLLQVRVVAVLGDEEQIAQAQDRVYEKYHLDSSPVGETASAGSANAESAIGGGNRDKGDASDTTKLLETLEQEAAPQEDTQRMIEQSDNSLVRLVNHMIMDARAKGVSDIHIESHPAPGKSRVRFRRDGILAPYLELPYTYRSALLARIKIMADLDISERRKPQDGKIDFSRFVSGQKLELRVATIPTAGGLEDVVMRLLSSAKPIAMDKLGLSPQNLSNLKEAVSRPYGMVLCVGPTGSGKTTTLHSVLGYLNTPQRKIWTAEDPVEITQPDLRQVQVNAKIDWTFAKALRSFLRADPDIIMVGEIRDEETAKIAVEASLTGHMVLSTLHTNSAAETIVRLIDMGMDPFNFADSLLAVLAQRLVRRLCVECRVKEPASEAFINELTEDYLRAIPAELRPDREALHAQWAADYGEDGVLQRYFAPGCRNCQNTGLRGRVGIHELLVVNQGLRRLIQTSARPEQLQHEGMLAGDLRTLRQDGICKVLAGQTVIEEVRANSNA